MAFVVAGVIPGVIGAATAYGAYQTSEAQKSAGAASLAAGNSAAGTILKGTNLAMDKITEILKPYTDTGTQSLDAQKNLSGLNGVQAQQDSINALQNSPAYQALGKAGQDAIMAQASATGGVRGGNTQGALAQFGTANLANALDRQYAQYGGLTQLGANAASQLGGADASLLSTGYTNAGNAKLAGANANIQAQLGSAATMANLPGNVLGSMLGTVLGAASLAK